MPRLYTVIVSGGMDSLTLLDHIRIGMVQPFDRILAVSFDYGQRHAKELAYARASCDKRNIELVYVDISHFAGLLPGSSQTDLSVPVPEGAYDEPSMKKTVVPGRNTVMLSMALAITEAQLNKADYGTWDAWVCFGAHAGDHFIYPDCRERYVAALSRAFSEATEGKVTVVAPYINMTKGEICKLGLGLGVDYAESWTCYKGEAEPCGKCGSCDERSVAFAEAGAPDPLLRVASTG